MVGHLAPNHPDFYLAMRLFEAAVDPMARMRVQAHKQAEVKRCRVIILKVQARKQALALAKLEAVVTEVTRDS